VAWQLPFHYQYCISHRLGKGCFAKVYSARCLPWGTPGCDQVAVKVTDLRSQSSLATGVVELNKHRYKAIQREADMLRRASGHPHIVGVFSDHVEDFWSYLVMERCDRSLLQEMESWTEMTEYTMKRVFAEMLEALCSIHAKSIVHRDIKPDNFLVSGPGSTVKLCDFGLSDIVSDRRPKLKNVYGTAPFMSPEMLGNRGYDTQTDMWSFAVLVYVLLLGHFPYKPLDRTSKGMTSAILAGIPAPCFEPKRSILRMESRAAVTDGAVEFMRALLVRNPASRSTAAGALQFSWLRDYGTPQERWFASSLKLMYSEAKQAGAFTVDNVPNETGVEKAQVEHDGKLCEDLRRHCDTQSTQASAFTQTSDFDPSMSRSPCWSHNFDAAEFPDMAYSPYANDSRIQSQPYCFVGLQYAWA